VRRAQAVLRSARGAAAAALLHTGPGAAAAAGAAAPKNPVVIPAAAHSRTGGNRRHVSGAALFGAALVLASAAAFSLPSVDAEPERGRRGGSGGGGGRAPSWLGDALSSAAASGDVTRLQQLLDTHQPRQGANLAHRFGWSPLHVAVANNQLAVVKYLLARPEIDVNRRDGYMPDERDLLLRVAQLSARHSAFPALNPDLGAALPDEPSQGFTALHYAALLAEPQIVDMLLAAGADVDVTAHGFTPDKAVDVSRLPEGTEEQRTRKERMQRIADKLAATREQRASERERQEKEERLRFPLELKLSKEMIGQELPIISVASAMRRRENGWIDPAKPMVFLFLGSSGVGKTMLAKELARHVVKDPDAFIRIDCSEYQAKHELARLIGSPPGYVGHEEGGQLTTKLAKHPNAVVLLDEVEKAHQDVLTLLLATFDEGRLTDGKGQTISCPQAVFIMTSNLVQDEIRDAIDNGYELRPRHSILKEHLTQSTEALRALGGITSTPLAPEEGRADATATSSSGSAVDDVPVKAVSPEGTVILPGAVPVQPADAASPPQSADAVAQHMSKLASDTERFLRFVVHPILKRAFKRDEFIGRINDIVIFHPFSQSDLERTVRMELDRWSSRARERHGIELDWSQRLVDSLSTNYDERYGYRSISYAVEKRVINVIAAAHERDRIGKGCKVLLDLEDMPSTAGSGDDKGKPHPHGQQPAVIIRQVIRPGGQTQEHDGKRKKFLGIF